MPLSDDPMLGKGPWLDAKEQARIRRMWPEGVDWIEGLKFYKPTQYSQRSAIYIDNSDVHGVMHREQSDFGGTVPNPNRIDDPKWGVPGGLHGLTGWKSYVGVALPEGGKVKVWNGRVHTPTSPGQGLPKKEWEFPDGTQFVDALVCENRMFEVRVRRKAAGGKWVSSVPFKGDSVPHGYQGAGRSCASCHEGIENNYGIHVRGSGTIISAPILKEGTLAWDFDHWPLELVNASQPQRIEGQAQPDRLPGIVEPFGDFGYRPSVSGGRRRFR